MRFGSAVAIAMRLLGAKLLSVDEHRNALLAAGFIDVELFEEYKKGWLCGVGVKVAASAG
jgi:hypothetical protein